MNVETMSMDPRIAAMHYKDYRKQVRKHREERLAAAAKKIHDGNATMRQGRAERSQVEKEDETLMLAYREMARGRRVLNIADAIASAGLNKQKLPAIAVARADWSYCHLSLNRGQLVFASSSFPSYDYRWNRWKDSTIAFRDNLLGAELTDSSWRTSHALPRVGNQRALVPAIPAQFRPAGALTGYHILFEAVWEQHAPPDPLLLKHVSGHIYTVLAQWDLTPLEKAVLEGRLVSS